MAFPLVPVALVLTGGALAFALTRPAAAASAPPAAPVKEKRRFSLSRATDDLTSAGKKWKDVFKKQTPAPAAAVTAAKAAGLVVSGLDEDRAAAEAFADACDAAGVDVGEVSCTETMCFVEIDGSDEGQQWFESVGQNLARNAASGTGSQAALVVRGDRTYVAFSDDVSDLVDEAAEQGAHAISLTEPVPLSA